MVRTPAVAGQFYPGSEQELRSELSRLVHPVESPRKALGVISPHAGYVYSGAIAGTLFSRIEIPATVLILGPNHHGIGAAVALYPTGAWQTPLGALPIADRLNDLLAEIPYIQYDSIAHQREHSLEVQAPFLQFLRPDCAISAICLGQGDFAAIREIGEGIAAAIRAFGDDVLIVASSDMTHYESAASARHKDRLALDRALVLDPEGLMLVCQSERISMCGVIPAAVMLVAAQALGATEAELVAYATSGDVTGDDSQVVGYAAVTIA